MEGKKVGFIGGGNMAYAIAKGLVSSGLIKKENIITSAKTQTRLQTVWKVSNRCRTWVSNVDFRVALHLKTTITGIY